MDIVNIISTKSLCYNYEEGHPALDSVDIDIKKGGITAILGGNGAGKSTLFLNLNGVFTPKSGEVYLGGEKVNYTKSGIAKLRERVGIVFQDPNDQLFSASVKKDIAFGLINMKLPQAEIDKRLDEVISQTGIGELLDKPTHALSYGQKKRVAIAGVLAMKPDVVILDEPTAGLDPQGVSEVLKLLEKIRQELGITVILATHDVDLVPVYCDYIYVLDHGKVVMGGTCDEVFSKPDLLRKHSLRLPRIAHLMEILNTEDDIDVSRSASTISAARRTLLDILEGASPLGK